MWIMFLFELLWSCIDQTMKLKTTKVEIIVYFSFGFGQKGWKRNRGVLQITKMLFRLKFTFPNPVMKL